MGHLLSRLVMLCTAVVAGTAAAQGKFDVSNQSIQGFGSWASSPGAQVVSGDFNGDGKADLAATGVSGRGTLPVALSNGNGAFNVIDLPIQNFAFWTSLAGAKVVGGDFNGDGRDDLAVTGVAGWGSVPVAFSNGDGSFSVSNELNPSFPIWAASPGAQVVSGDFNGDGRDDLAVTGVAGWGSVPVAFSNGNGSFSISNELNPSFPIWAASPGAQVVSGDFNGDGRDDLAVTGVAGWGSVPVAFSNGDGSFSISNEPIENFAQWAALPGAKIVSGDFNDDGKDDLAVTGVQGWGSVPVAFSSGSGSFSVSNEAVADFPVFAAVANTRLLSGDFNGDGRSDLALAGGAGWSTQPLAFAVAPLEAFNPIGNPAQSSTEPGWAVAGLAVDGNTDGDWGAATTTRTRWGDASPWWYVDLGVDKAIASISIHNRTDADNGFHLSGAKVFVSSVPFATPDAAATEADANVWTYTLPADMTSEALHVVPVNGNGRYLRIQLPMSGRVLNMAEVVVNEALPPVAFNPTSNPAQSSTGWGAPAARALDGNSSGNWGDATLTHTVLETNAWWYHDLGAVQQIPDITVYNRTDCCSERLSGAKLFVSDTPFTSADPAVTQADVNVGTFDLGDMTGVAQRVVAVNRSGRYLRIQLAGTGYLSLAEVVVAAPSVAAWNPTTNPAMSTMLAGNPSDLAVDGNTSGNWGDGSVASTDNEPNAWWYQDLGAVQQIPEITVYNRTDCCTERLSGAKLFVSQVPFTSADPAATQADPDVATFDLGDMAGIAQRAVVVNQPGRYIRVQLPGTNFLSLAEVVVAAPSVVSVLVTPPAEPATTEPGGTVEFPIVLGGRPRADVTLQVTSSNPAEGMVTAGGELTFTVADWDVPQTVTVTGQDDGIADGHIGYVVQVASFASADPDYAALAPVAVALTNTDDDLFDLTIFEQAAAAGSAAVVDLLAPRLQVPGLATLLDVQVTGIQTADGALTGNIENFYGRDWTFIVYDGGAPENSFVGIRPLTPLTHADIDPVTPGMAALDEVLSYEAQMFVAAAGDVELASDALPALATDLLEAFYEDGDDVADGIQFTLEITQGAALFGVVNLGEHALVADAIDALGGASSIAQVKGSISGDVLGYVLGGAEPPAPTFRLEAALPAFAPRIGRGDLRVDLLPPPSALPGDFPPFPQQVQPTFYIEVGTGWDDGEPADDDAPPSGGGLAAESVELGVEASVDGVPLGNPVFGYEVVDVVVSAKIKVQADDPPELEAAVAMADGFVLAKPWGVTWMSVEGYKMTFGLAGSGDITIGLDGTTSIGTKAVTLGGSVLIAAATSGLPPPNRLTFAVNDGPDVIGQLALRDLVIAYNLVRAEAGLSPVPTDPVPDVAITGLAVGDGPELEIEFSTTDFKLDMRGGLRVLGADLAEVERAFFDKAVGIEIVAQNANLSTGGINFPAAAVGVVAYYESDEPPSVLFTDTVDVFGAGRETELEISRHRAVIRNKTQIGTLFRFDFAAESRREFTTLEQLESADYRFRGEVQTTDIEDWVRANGQGKATEAFNGLIGSIDLALEGYAAAVTAVGTAEGLVQQAIDDFESDQTAVLANSSAAYQRWKALDVEVYGSNSGNADYNGPNPPNPLYPNGITAAINAIPIQACNDQMRGACAGINPPGFTCTQWSGQVCKFGRCTPNVCVDGYPTGGDCNAWFPAWIPDPVAIGACEVANAPNRAEKLRLEGEKRLKVPALAGARSTYDTITSGVQAIPVELDPRVVAAIVVKEAAEQTRLALQHLKDGVGDYPNMLLNQGANAVPTAPFQVLRASLLGQLAQAITASGGRVALELEYQLDGAYHRDRFAFSLVDSPEERAWNGAQLTLFALAIATRNVLRAADNVPPPAVVPHDLKARVAELFLDRQAIVAAQAATVDTTNGQSGEVAHGGTVEVPDGIHVVRYGANGQFAALEFTGPTTVVCSNTVFGDPAPGVQKSCAVDADAAVAAFIDSEGRASATASQSALDGKNVTLSARLQGVRNGYLGSMQATQGAWAEHGGFQELDIGTGPDGSVWTTGSRGCTELSYGCPSYWNGDHWVQDPTYSVPAQTAADAAPGYVPPPDKPILVAIDAGPGGRVWAVTGDGGIVRRGPSGWSRIPGGASDIGVGANGSAWLTAPNDTIWRYANGGWTQVAGAAYRVDVDPAGNAWVVNRAGAVFSWMGSTWLHRPGVTAKDVSIGSTGVVMVVDTDGKLQQWTGSAWQALPSGNLQRVAVDARGYAWATDSTTVWAHDKAAGFVVAPPRATGFYEFGPPVTILSAAYYGNNEALGSGATGFADVNGDGYDDIYAAHPTGINVLYNDKAGGFVQATGFAGNGWIILEGIVAERAIGLAKINGDSKDDLFIVHNVGGYWRDSLFAPWHQPTTDAFYGTQATGFADLNGDGFADYYAVNDSEVWVRLNDRSANFGASQLVIPADSYNTGAKAVGFADISGDGYADLYYVGADKVWVRWNNQALGFSRWDVVFTGGFYGTKATTFADINGDGYADFVVVNDNSTTVRYSQ